MTKSLGNKLNVLKIGAREKEYNQVSVSLLVCYYSAYNSVLSNQGIKKQDHIA